MAEMVVWYLINFALNRLEIMFKFIILISICLLVSTRQYYRPWLNSQISKLREAIQAWKIEQKRQTAEGDRHQRAELLIQQAKSAIVQDNYNPFNIDLLLTAIQYNQESYSLVNKVSCLQGIDNIQIEIDRRHQFQTIFNTANTYFHLKQFRQALDNFLLAQELYSPQRLVQTIAECREQTHSEDIYLQSIAEAKTLSYAGKFRDALRIVNDAVAKFPNPSGETLQFKLGRIIAAKEQINLGEIEQKNGDLSAAKSHYLAALTLLPEWNKPKLKLVAIELKIGEIDCGIERLATLESPKTKYLEGLLCTRQQQYQQAELAWSSVANRDLVREHRQIISKLTIAQFQLIQPQIKQSIERGELEQARTLSLNFIDRFGSNDAIETNLNSCILPGIEVKIWKTEKWDKIAIFAREQWANQRDIKSLHNWAIARYYHAQNDDNIEELIMALSAAIANIDLDPSIQDLPWLGTKSLPASEISDKLWQILEQRIESIKESDLSQYLHLRDRYRQEFWAMKLAQEIPDAKITVGELTIPPACYQRYYAQIQLGEEIEVWKTLYTDWGRAVAACLAGDLQRAETIKTELKVNSILEEFACHFITYERGCYYLQQQDWHSAIVPLNSIKQTIDRHLEWWLQLEELCAICRTKLSDIDENLEFARFWYDLLASLQSEDYLVEYRAVRIQYRWQTSAVSDMLSLIKIRQLLDDYPHHPVVIGIFSQIQEYHIQTHG